MPEPKAEIKFVLSAAEIRLLIKADERFAKEFRGKKLGARYEFTYSREALESLSFWVTGTVWFILPPKERPKYRALIKKLNRLRQLSDDLSEILKRKNRTGSLSKRTD